MRSERLALLFLKDVHDSMTTVSCFRILYSAILPSVYFKIHRFHISLVNHLHKLSCDDSIDKACSNMQIITFDFL